MRWILILLVLLGLSAVSYWGWETYYPVERTALPVEQSPWVTVVVSGNSLLVDSEGTFLLPLSSSEDNVATMIVTGITSDMVSSGRLTEDSLHAVQAIVDPILGSFAQYEWRLELGELRKLGTEAYFVDVTLLQNDSLPIRIGEGRYVEEKISALSKLLEREPDVFDRVSYIDLRVRQKVYVKTK